MTRTVAVPLASVPAWLAVGYVDAGPVAYGQRGEGEHRRMTWEGVGVAPVPAGER